MSFNAPVLKKMVEFIEKIGIPVDYGLLPTDTFLPSLYIPQGRLLVDKEQLKYLGDILHKVGHVALMTEAERNSLMLKRLFIQKSNIG